VVIRRVKDRWHNSTPEDDKRDVLTEKNLDDQASALAFIIWRQALNGAINLHAEDFRYDDDQQRVAVITELLAFLVQHIDRMSYEFLTDTQRQQLLIALCERVGDQIQDNLTDIAGPGQYRPPFVKLLNERFAKYAELSYQGATPGYDTFRFLGHQVLDVMGHDQTNRWVIDQIIDIDAPNLVEQTTRSTNRLFGLDEE
jgi:hypothetical protein